MSNRFNYSLSFFSVAECCNSERSSIREKNATCFSFCVRVAASTNSDASVSTWNRDFFIDHLATAFLIIDFSSV